jgi:Mn2+/Fe2+ NRAMP family transporter
MGGAVPLSEHEQRQLDQIERALYAEDPKFAQTVLGVGLLMAGVVSKYIWIGVAGFVVMLACSMWALTSWRHVTGVAASRSGPVRERRSARPSGPKFMERLEERWRRRQEGDR